MSQAWPSSRCPSSMNMDHWDTRACGLLVNPGKPQLQGLDSKGPKILGREQRESLALGHWHVDS